MHTVFIPEFVCRRDVPQGRDKASQSFQERTAYIAFLPSPERSTNAVLNCLLVSAISSIRYIHIKMDEGSASKYISQNH